MRLLALDTGKTKTFAVLIDEELRVLGSSVTGPGDVSLDPSLILSNIRGAIDAALKEA
ncbi:MAG: ATPase, partial [Thermoprotei archaeon]